MEFDYDSNESNEEDENLYYNDYVKYCVWF